MQFNPFFLCMLLTAATLPSLAVARPLTELLEELPTVNPTLKAEQENLRAEEERLKQARAAFLPKANLNAATGLNSDATSDKYRNASLTLTQPLFAGGRDKAAYDSISAQILGATSNYNTSLQQQRLALADAYLSFLGAQAQKKQTAQYVDVLTENLAAQEARFKSGESSRIDVMQATAFLERGKADDANATASITGASSQLEALLNTPLPADFQPVWPDMAIAPPTLEAAKLALEKHPAFIAAKAQVDAAAATVRGAYGQLLPSINAEASAVDYSWSTVPDNQTVGLTLSMPLFAGGGNLSQIRQAKYKKQSAQDTLNATLNTLTQQAVTAWHNLAASEANLTALTAAEAAQAEATKGIKARYNEGEADLLDTLEAEQDLLLAQTATTTAQRTHILNGYRLLTAIGEWTK